MKEMLNVHAAKTNFSKLLARVANGEEIVIAKDGIPVAKLVPYASAPAPRSLGLLAGKVWMSDDAFDTPEWLIDAFESGGEVLSPATPIAPSRRRRATVVAEPAVAPLAVRKGRTR